MEYKNSKRGSYSFEISKAIAPILLSSTPRILPFMHSLSSTSTTFSYFLSCSEWNPRECTDVFHDWVELEIGPLGKRSVLLRVKALLSPTSGAQLAAQEYVHNMDKAPWGSAHKSDWHDICTLRLKPLPLTRSLIALKIYNYNYWLAGRGENTSGMLWTMFKSKGKVFTVLT